MKIYSAHSAPGWEVGDMSPQTLDEVSELNWGLLKC